MRYRYILFFILGIDALILYFKISDLSISYYEASLLYGNLSFLQIIIKSSIYLFGQNDIALRIPMISFHILSAILLYAISEKYIVCKKNRLWIVVIFMLLPGVISSAIIVNSAGIVIFGLLLFIYLDQKNTNSTNKLFEYLIYSILFIYSLIDAGFVYLFLSLVIYSIYIKNKKYFLFNILMAVISIYIYSFDIYGLPKGHFLDTIGIYAAIFTPIIFIYIFYVLYRRYFTKQIDILWFISSVTLVLSLFLSFRQKIELDQFAPYLIIALPLAAQTFYSSYRVRLRMYRGTYRTLFTISLVFLIFNSLLVFYNKSLYIILDNPKKHFAYKMHVAKELASVLSNKNITCVKTKYRMQERLKFYGVTKCNENILTEYKKGTYENHNVTISYKDRAVYLANVTKLNNI